VDPGASQLEPPATPLDRDLYCPTCGYNLRGLSGDPIRCPECGRHMPRSELLGTRESAEYNFKDLVIAVDILNVVTVGLGGVVLAAPLALGLVGEACALTCLAISAMIGIVPATAAFLEIRRIRREPEWLSALGSYLAATVGAIYCLPLICVLCAALIHFALPVVGQASPPALVAVIGGSLATVLAGIGLRPVGKLWRLRESAFRALVHATRAGYLGQPDVSLHPAVPAASFSPAVKHESLYETLVRVFGTALAQVAGVPPEQIDPAVRPATDPQFGDYQCNAAMPLARSLKAKPREVAQRIKAAGDRLLADIAEPLEIAGPGFINIRLRAEFLARYLSEIAAPPADESEPDRVGLTPVERPLRVVVEYSQPNIAKQMHVGHLRSTIIGDVFARVLAFEGHEVIRQNHIGDWGTQFGMLIRWYRQHPLPTPQTHPDVLEAIEDDYRAAQERFDTDPQFAAEARQAVGQLQSGNPQAVGLWKQICAESWRAFTETYERLDVLLKPEDVRGESFYNDRLPQVIEELRRTFGAAEDTAQEQWHTAVPPPSQGGAGGGSGSLPADAANPPVVPPERGDGSRPRAEVREDQGAVCVFMYDESGEPLFRNPDGQMLPMIIQKSDGAYLYATTDLAAIRYRLKELKFPSGVGAQRVIYVTDSRQKLHFQMFLAAARAAGWITDQVSVEHVTFGSVLGPDRRPLKTREGQNVKLCDLLDEAERRAYALLDQRSQEQQRDMNVAGSELEGSPLTGEEKRHIARRVGIAAVKYADLCRDRNADYVFNWDTMLAMQGNTAPYMMYAYARIRSIYRKAAERFGSPDVYAPGERSAKLELCATRWHPTERALALRLARLREAIHAVAADLAPHTLCAYLYNLAGDFMRFYESCPVLAAPDEPTRLSRMRLCDLTARTLKLGLGLLGIQVIERM
jgi:arginyl-tRNA synthetase